METESRPIWMAVSSAMVRKIPSAPATVRVRRRPGCGGRKQRGVHVRPGIAFDAAIPQPNDPRAGFRDKRVMRGDHQRHFLTRVQVPEQGHDFLAGGAVQVAGRLVEQHQRRFVGQGAGDGDALLLAAREFRGFVIGPILQAHPFQQPKRALRRAAARRL